MSLVLLKGAVTRILKLLLPVSKAGPREPWQSPLLLPLHTVRAEKRRLAAATELNPCLGGTVHAAV